MGAATSVETMRPEDLSPEARSLWAAFRAARPELASPYFDLRYLLAAGEVAPHCAVAVIRRGGEITAFLPFQRRGGLIQPLGAPLTDYHGPVARPGTELDLEPVVAALGARRFRFTGLVAGGGPERPASARHAMVADLSGGFDAYLDARRAAGHGAALKDKRRRARLLEREHGPVSFTLEDDSPDILRLIIRLKRAQMRRTGQHDVFASSWTRDLLARLAQGGAEDFGLRYAVLRAGGRVVAAEIGLRSGRSYHLWFPVYDRAFARYSPGALMTFETLRALAGRGVDTVDFGPSDDAYKGLFADRGAEVLEGEVAVGASWRAGARRLLSLTPGLHDAARLTERKLDRRMDRIAACEPSLNGQVGAAASFMAGLARRHPGKSIGVAVGLGLGLSLLAD